MRFSDVMEPQRQLPSYLIKPVQRICKYPLLLQEMIKNSDKDMPNYTELTEGLAAIKRVADRVNETRRKVENQMLVKDLEKRVKGWHDYATENFGDLLLHDKFVMSSNDIEKELMVYLFENIMICCKELQSKKNKKKAPMLQLKGRIFISSITGVTPYSRNGVYALKVLWRDAQIGSFSLRCRNEEQLRLWQTTLERLINSFAQPETHIVAEVTSHRPPPAVPESASSPTAHISPNDQLHVHDIYQYRRKKVDDDAMSFIATSDDEEEEEEPEVERELDATTSGRPAPRRGATMSLHTAHRPGPQTNYRGMAHQSMPAPGRHQRVRPEYGLQKTPSPVSATTEHSDQEPSPVERARRPSDWSAPLANQMNRMHIDGRSPPPYHPNGARPPLHPGHRSPSTGHAGMHPPPVPHPTTAQRNGHLNVAPGPMPRRQTSPNIYSGHPHEAGERPPMPHPHHTVNGATSPTMRYARAPASHPLPDLSDQVKIKVNHMNDVYVIFVPRNVTYRDLLAKLEKKIRICGGETPQPPETLKIQYFDEDGDRVTIKNDEDVQISFECRDPNNPSGVLNFFVC
jgi:cell division control protein 24